ncbi:Lysozyme RrrD [Sodalis glossinidius str. 'morsitans']|uniref:Lysozyme n=1 Tax=Sodalis glossinidius (strain morsitans) TaxID=343509 RepID=A0A193QN48_SODGM|nr:hypothetical protein [Sodalis glossinidius]CRL46523.1 Lysozyme RrrD [Sodalis glossinidius str. 'morsitans']
MNPELRNRLIKATAGGAIALATVLIQWHEGVLYTPYRDSGGVLSVCYGHTGAVAISSPVSATSLLDSDQKAAMAIVDANVTAPLTENQKAALASFVYNVARGARALWWAAILAGSALLYFHQKAKDARESAIGLKEAVTETTEALMALSSKQLVSRCWICRRSIKTKSPNVTS